MARESKRRRNDDDDDDRPSSRRRDDDRPRPSRRGEERKNPWIIWGPVIGVLVIGLAVGIYFIAKPKKKNTDTAQNSGGPNAKGGEPKDEYLVQTKALRFSADCKPNSIERLLVNDAGDKVGINWASYDATGKKSFLDRFDAKSGNRLNRISLKNIDQVRFMSLSPSGNLLLYTEVALDDGFKKKITVHDLAADKPMVQRNQPYPKGDLTSSMMWADFVANDRILTVSMNRQVKLFSLPDFKEEAAIKVAGNSILLTNEDPYTKYYKDHALERRPQDLCRLER